MFLEKNRAFFSIFLIFQTLKSMKRTKIDFRERFGFDIDKIAEGTGLSREEIEKL